MHPRPRRLAAAALVAGVALTPLLVPSPAGSASAERHCVVEVVDRRADGELVLSSPRCHRTYPDAMADARGVDTAMTADAAEVVAAATFVLGTHFDGASFTGSSISVTGSDCAGGYTNLSSSWDNRISSTLNGCYRIRHFDGSNMSGASETVLGGGGNLGSLNNRANSIQYSS